jgi:hypothetical protein
MKNYKTLILLSALIVCGKFSYAQTPFPPLDLMDSNSKLPSSKNLKFKGKYVIQIDNINLSLYKVEGTVSQKDFNTEMPEIFKGIKLPGFLTTKLPAIKDDQQQAKLASMDNDNTLKKKTIELNLQVIADALEKIKATVKLSNTYKNLYSSCDKKFAAILSEKHSVTNIYLNTNHTTETEITDALRQYLNTTIANAINAQKEIDKDLPVFYTEMETKLGIASLKKTIEELESKTANNITLSEVEKIRLNSAKKKIASFEELKKDLDEQLAKAKGFIDELKKFDDDNKVEDLVNNYKMINKSNFTYYSDEFTVKQDEVQVEIKVSTENRLSCDVPSKKTYSASYLTKGGLKLDFSSGVSINGGNDDFMGRDLQYKSINDSTVQIEAKDGGKRLLLSVGALMHIYWRTGNKLNFALSPGLSTTTAFDGIDFHLGGSVLFGGENRIVLTAGLVMREAKILDRNYNYNSQYQKKAMPEAVPTIKVFPKTGWFFSVTYNWSKQK